MSLLLHENGVELNFAEVVTSHKGTTMRLTKSPVVSTQTVLGQPLPDRWTFTDPTIHRPASNVSSTTGAKDRGKSGPN